MGTLDTPLSRTKSFTAGLRNSMKVIGRNRWGGTAPAGTEAEDASQQITRERNAVNEEHFEALLDGPAVNKVAVVGIDVGATTCGFAYAMTDDKKIRVVKRKEPTCALFERETHNLIEFGSDARNRFRKAQAGQALLSSLTGKNSSKWERDFVYVEHDIKMALFRQNQDSDELMSGSFKVNGGISYFEIMAAILRRMKEQAIENIAKDQDINLKVDEILWVVTVPSIFRESDKQFMRRAACSAGIIRDEFSGDLVLALESEAAAVWSEVLFNGKSAKHTLSVGSRLLVLDCGGGTIDISVVQVVRMIDEETQEPELVFRQMLPPTGMATGAQNIDRRARRFIRHFLGNDNFAKVWKQPDLRMELMDEWERIKCSVTSRSFVSKGKSRAKPMTWNFETVLAELNVKLPELVSNYNAFTRERALRRKSHDKPIQLEYRKSLTRAPTSILVPPTLLKDCFDEVVSRIVEKTRNVLSTLDENGVDHLVLNGGLAQNEYVQQVMKRLFGRDAIVHTPRDASLAVMRGAVKYGCNPKVINSRRSRYTIGVKVTIPFVRGKHSKKPHLQHKFYDNDLRDYFLRDVFKTFVVRGQLVEVNERYKHTFAPASENHSSIKFDIFASTSKRVEYVTESGCKKLATIIVPIEKGSIKSLVLALSFGYTELRACILDEDDTVVQEVPLQYDRFGEDAVIVEETSALSAFGVVSSVEGTEDATDDATDDDA